MMPSLSLFLLGRSRGGNAPPPQGPLLDLSFASGSLPSGITFTRASTATYFNSSGMMQTAVSDTPRFDYDPATLALRGLLVEPQRTNIIPNSLSGWSGNNATVSFNNTASPDGATNGMRLTDNYANAAHSMNAGSLSFTNGTTYAVSAFFKAGTDAVGQITVGYQPFTQSPTPYANFDLTNIAVGGSGSIVSSSIRNSGGNWRRCHITATATVSTSGSAPQLVMTANNTSLTRTGWFVGSGLYFYTFGGQIELGSSPTSYIPTTGTSVTRAADVVQFTIPSGVATLRYTFDDDSTQDVAVSVGAYTVPANLNRAHIKRIHSV